MSLENRKNIIIDNDIVPNDLGLDLNSLNVEVIKAQTTNVKDIEVQTILSPLKEQRAKKKTIKAKKKNAIKATKLRKLIKQQNLNNMKKKIKEKEKDVSSTKVENEEDFVLWEEGKSLLMDINNILLQYDSVVVLATTSLKDYISDDKDMFLKLIKIMSDDLINLKSKWKELAEQITGKYGQITAEDLPSYYVLYDNFVSLQNDINIILADPAFKLTELINSLKVKEINEEPKDA